MVVQPTMVKLPKESQIYTWASLHPGDVTEWLIVQDVLPAGFPSPWAQVFGLWVPAGTAEFVVEGTMLPDFSDVQRITSYDFPYGPVGLAIQGWYAVRGRVNAAQPGTDITMRLVVL